LYHEPNYVPVECELPTVVTVCDLSALLHPEWHPAERVAFFERSFPKGLGQCVHVLTISEFSRREIVDTLGISPDRVTCTHLGVRDGMRALSVAECQPVLRRRELSWGQYLLYVGTIEPRKNIDTLMRAYCDLPPELRARCPLVLAGGWGWRAEKLRELYDTEARAKGVRHLGYVADAELPALYSGARALMFPSLYEGFGLPTLEMQACGGAVLASTAAAVAEVLEGSNAHLVAPLDVCGWRDAMAKSVTDNDWLAGLRRGAQRHAARFTWDACAHATLRVYRSLQGIGLSQAVQLNPQAAA
jgi:alpha-1,3-rhamnosyl/mannosyltransferase